MPAADLDPPVRIRPTLADAGWFVATYVLLTAVWVGIGELVTHWPALERRDLAVERHLAAHRTDTWNTLTTYGSMLSESWVKIGLTLVVCVALYVVFRRTLEPLLVAIPLVIEAAVFITTTAIVGRPRPAVTRLEGSPVGSSFPSGHTAAAAVYAAIILVIVLHTARRWPVIVAGVLVAAVVAAVAGSRMYRGMHHPTDVVFGALLGAVCVVWSRWFVMRMAGPARQVAR